MEQPFSLIPSGIITTFCGDDDDGGDDDAMHFLH